MPSLIRHLPFLDALLARRSRSRSAACAPALRDTLHCARTADLDERRGEAMRHLYPKLRHWRATAFDRSAALHAYSYLSEANGIDELERRIHELERRRHFRH